MKKAETSIQMTIQSELSKTIELMSLNSKEGVQNELLKVQQDLDSYWIRNGDKEMATLQELHEVEILKAVESIMENIISLMDCPTSPLELGLNSDNDTLNDL